MKIRNALIIISSFACGIVLTWIVQYSDCKSSNTADKRISNSVIALEELHGMSELDAIKKFGDPISSTVIPVYGESHDSDSSVRPKVKSKRKFDFKGQLNLITVP